MLGGLGPPCGCLCEIMAGEVTTSSVMILLVAAPGSPLCPHPPPPPSCWELEQARKVWRVHPVSSSEPPCHLDSMFHLQLLTPATLVVGPP